MGKFDVDLDDLRGLFDKQRDPHVQFPGINDRDATVKKKPIRERAIENLLVGPVLLVPNTRAQEN